MSRVRLRVDDFDRGSIPRYQFDDPQHGAQRVPILRLVATVLIGPDPDPLQQDTRDDENALIDTGAWLTVIRYESWQDYERLGLVERLGPALPSATENRHLSIAGHRVEFEFGRIWMAVVDTPSPGTNGHVRTHERLPAVPVLAQLLMDSAVRLPLPIVLGLHHGVLDGRRLRRVPVPAAAPTTRRVDVGQQYGQAWWLDELQ